MDTPKQRLGEEKSASVAGFLTLNARITRAIADVLILSSKIVELGAFMP